MGDHVDRPLTRIAAWVAVSLVVVLNVALVVLTFTG